MPRVTRPPQAPAARPKTTAARPAPARRPQAAPAGRPPGATPPARRAGRLAALPEDASLGAPPTRDELGRANGDPRLDNYTLLARQNLRDNRPADALVNLRAVARDRVTGEPAVGVYDIKLLAQALRGVGRLAEAKAWERRSEQTERLRGAIAAGDARAVERAVRGGTSLDRTYLAEVDTMLRGGRPDAASGQRETMARAIVRGLRRRSDGDAVCAGYWDAPAQTPALILQGLALEWAPKALGGEALTAQIVARAGSLDDATVLQSLPQKLRTSWWDHLNLRGLSREVTATLEARSTDDRRRTPQPAASPPPAPAGGPVALPWTDILGVKAGASVAEITRVFRRRLDAQHPSRGGDVEVTRVLVRAYEQALAASKSRAR